METQNMLFDYISYTKYRFNIPTFYLPSCIKKYFTKLVLNKVFLMYLTLSIHFPARLEIMNEQAG